MARVCQSTVEVDNTLSGKGEPARSIFWLDSAGQTEPLHSTAGFYGDLRFSPDGKHLVFSMADVQAHQDLWIQETERRPSVRLTSLSGPSESPVWSPDGAHILFASSNKPSVPEHLQDEDVLAALDEVPRE